MLAPEPAAAVLRFLGFVPPEIESRSCGSVLVGTDYEAIANSMASCFSERGSVRKREMEDHSNDGLAFHRPCCIVDSACGNDLHTTVPPADTNKQTHTIWKARFFTVDLIENLVAPSSSFVSSRLPPDVVASSCSGLRVGTQPWGVEPVQNLSWFWGVGCSVLLL